MLSKFCGLILLACPIAEGGIILLQCSPISAMLRCHFVDEKMQFPVTYTCQKMIDTNNLLLI